jgi:hypothetical protein
MLVHPELTASGWLKVHHYAEVRTLEIHLSPHFVYGYRLAIGYCTPVKGGHVISPSFFFFFLVC